MKYDVCEKRYDESVPMCKDGIERMRHFSIGGKFRLSNYGYRNFPKCDGFVLPNDGYNEKYRPLVMFNKKRWALLPFID